MNSILLSNNNNTDIACANFVEFKYRVRPRSHLEIELKHVTLNSVLFRKI